MALRGLLLATHQWRRYTLDIEQRQVLVGYGDAELHHRVLFVHLGGAKWVVGSPTGDIFEEDLSTTDALMPLGRNVPLPDHTNNIFAFRISEMTDEVLTRLTDQATRLCSVLGGVPPAPVAAQGAAWLYADPAEEKFGQVLEPSILAQETTIIRGSMALCEVYDGGTAYWVMAQHVADADKQEWLSEKREGTGRDPRLLPLAALPNGNLPSFSSANSRTAATPATWARFRGPSAAKELAGAISGSGNEPMAYCSTWEAAAGVVRSSSLCIEHRSLVFLFWMMMCEDRLDVGQLASAEHCARRILQIEKAHKKNAKAPSFDGLQPYDSHMGDPAQGARTAAFDEHVASENKSDALFMKQNRLAKEEEDAAKKNKNKKKKDGKGDDD